jgi:aminomethyltransferase
MDGIAKKTPFFSWHAAHGAVLYEKGGWVRPARYESAVAEHLQVREAGGIIDVHSMGKITVEGSGASTLMDLAATNDIAGLKVGGARYTCLCAENGGILDDVIVYRTGECRFYLITNTLSRERVLDFLRCLADESTHVSDVSSATAYIAVQGPRSRQLLAAAGVEGELSGSALGYFESAEVRLRLVPVLLARTGYTGELGFELNFPAEFALDVWTRLCEAGEALGVRPVGGEAMMSLRLEKGYRSYGSDIDLSTDVLEAGLGWVVDWSKPDFAGRAALAAIRERGTARRAVYLRAEAGVRISRGTALLDPRGRQVGTVTSGLYGPSLDAWVGLGYLAATVGVPGTLTVAGEHGGTVRSASRPFFDPAGQRLRA